MNNSIATVGENRLALEALDGPAHPVDIITGKAHAAPTHADLKAMAAIRIEPGTGQTGDRPRLRQRTHHRSPRTNLFASLR